MINQEKKNFEEKLESNYKFWRNIFYILVIPFPCFLLSNSLNLYKMYLLAFSMFMVCMAIVIYLVNRKAWKRGDY